MQKDVGTIIKPKATEPILRMIFDYEKPAKFCHVLVQIKAPTEEADVFKTKTIFATFDHPPSKRFKSLKATLKTARNFSFSIERKAGKFSFTTIKFETFARER